MNRKTQFVTGHIYHLYNRGVEKRDIFMNNKDYIRFIADILEFNNADAIWNFGRRISLIEVPLQSLPSLRSPQKPLVEILAFCLMPNHYHLMVKQHTDNGITEFMRKLGTGYTNYFNLIYNRVGPLFQGTFRAVLLEKESHLTHLPHYIHLNPLDIRFPHWKDEKLDDVDRAIEFLKTYKWSSFRDYIDVPTFPWVTNRQFLTQTIGDADTFLVRTREWLTEMYTDFVADVAIDLSD